MSWKRSFTSNQPSDQLLDSLIARPRDPTSCSSASPKKRKAPSASEATGLETSAEFLDGSSISVYYAQESQSRNPEASNDHVFVDYLKSDSRVQRQVQRQLEKLQRRSHTTHEGTKNFKSGLHRTGDNAVRHIIGWPHHYFFPSAGGQLPDYKELSPLQFMVGFLGCLQDESSNTIRSNMIEYGRHLFQDALETNWTTARHAHMILLQEIERGECSWRSPDTVEKNRIRNTARIITPKQTTALGKGNKDKICGDFNSNNCKFSSDHVVDGVIKKHACSYCYQEVGRLCLHKVQDCIRKKTSSSKEPSKST